MDTPIYKTRPMTQVERRIGRPLEDAIRELYIDRGMTQAQVAHEIGVEASTISRWMKDLGIEARFPGSRPEIAA